MTFNTLTFPLMTDNICFYCFLYPSHSVGRNSYLKPPSVQLPCFFFSIRIQVTHSPPHLHVLSPLHLYLCRHPLAVYNSH